MQVTTGTNGSAQERTIFDFDASALLQTQHPLFDSHCYGCTAGAGSSCGSATA